jgi:hypothetical protein
MTPPPLRPTEAAAAVNGQGGLDARTPLLLLPVHIQTRFIDPANSATGQIANVQSELWVRIYPDQIAINSHEPELTAQENADGQAYWNAVWVTGNPPANLDDAKAPWRLLASRYGPQRAAWIALALTPTNLSLQPLVPVPPGTTPVPLPIFPVVALRDSSWEKAATADALPDAWTVVLVSGANVTQFRGGPIVTPLAASLTPGTGFQAGSHVDAGLQWMVDFPAALAAGMALKIPLTAQQRASGFDKVFVYGTRAADATSSQTLTDLLNAHHYTDGFALVPQGAPTNNTPDASSAYSRKDPNYELSFATERQGPLTTNPACDGDALLNALGLVPGTLDHVAYADGIGSANGTDMLQALWSATLGYFLSQMMADVFTPSQIEQARQYVMANSVPRGPLPAMRVGRTPYGVLPVTSLRNYLAETARAASLEASLATFVKRLWPTWLNSSSAAPHMQRGGDPDQNLMSLLGMDASSENYQGRPVLGSDFTWNLFSFFGIPQSFQGQWWQNYFFFGRALLNSFGYGAWNPKLLGFAFGEKSFPVSFPTVQTPPVSETDPLADDADLGGGAKGNYIGWIAKASVADLQAENYPGAKPTSLLYKILRQSMLLAYSGNAGTAEVTAGTLAIAQIRESEFISVQPVSATLTPLQILARPSIPNPHLTWADYLATTKFSAGSPFAGLADMKASMGRLASLPTAELDRLLTETLDACSHRLDVWATTIANALLKRTRASQNTSIGLGCYGWVENVLPETGRTPVQGTELRQVDLLDSARRTTKLANVSLPVPKQPLTDNGGYVLAPSQTQAAVAAVLRNGYMTHKQTAEEGLLSIDLSSERVRRALWLIEGVQQGQSLNALLGYLFEDAMHDRNLDKYIQPFRDAFPVIGGKLTPSSAPAQSVAASNVVDGLALRTAWDTDKLPAGGNWGPGLPGAGADQNSVIAILQVIDDYADALGDLSISEAVFQAVRGNFGGAALMDAISRGSRPPLPDIVNTPRGGLDLTHRIAIIIAGTPVTTAAWSGITVRPRAAAEPWLDAWLSALLPDPSIVQCQVSWRDSGGAHTATVSLRDLDIGPLDLLSLADAAEVPQQSELEGRIIFHAGVPAGAQDTKIAFQSASLPAGSILFPDALYLAQKLRALVGAARPLGPQDMTVPENDAAKAGGVLNVVDLTVRATAALLSLNNDTQALAAAATPDDIRAALLQCSAYGVSGSVPGSASGADANLAVQAANVIAELQTRFKKASAVNLATAQLADFEGVFEAIFGGDFSVLPQFTPPDLATLQTAFSRSGALMSSDTLAPSRWLRQLAHVHPAVSRLDMALSTAQVLSGGLIYPPSLTLGQVPPPVTPPDRWLGLPLDPAHPPEKGRVAIACLAAGDPTTQSVYAGLLVDEWNERIPVVPVNASLAFHYEEPSARAPQSLLLAVCPDGRSVWDDGLIQAVLEETLELAKIRSVDLASVEQVGQILPALYFTLNLQGATFSTRFAVLKEVISGIGNIAAGGTA